MSRLWKVLVVIVVLVLCGTYALYALYYNGNYNVDLEVTIAVDDTGGVAISNLVYDCDAIGFADFWALFKGHSVLENESQFMVYFELDNVLFQDTWIRSVTVENGASSMITQTLSNVEPGAADLTISIRDSHSTLLTERTYEVVIG